jgi:hypothetical protein
MCGRGKPCTTTHGTGRRSRWTPCARPDLVCHCHPTDLHVCGAWTPYAKCLVRYPFMDSSVPATCCFLTTCRDTPVHLWNADTGKVRTPASLQVGAMGGMVTCCVVVRLRLGRVWGRVCVGVSLCASLSESVCVCVPFGGMVHVRSCCSPPSKSDPCGLSVSSVACHLSSVQSSGRDCGGELRGL